MAAEVLDLRHLSSYLSLPQETLTTVLDAPTADLVRKLLHAVAQKAREHEESRSQTLKLSVELENAVRGGETKARILKSSVDKGLKEAAELRQKLQSEEQAKAKLSDELESLKASTSSSTEEVNVLHARVSALESSNRDTVSLLESKSRAYDSLADELANQHQKTVELRCEVSTLEQSIQCAKAEVATAKFHEQGLQQEIEHLKRNNDWLDTELKTKTAEYTKYRKEKAVRIAEAQRQNEELSSTIDTLTRTEKNLRTRLDEVGQKADDAFSRIQELQGEAARKEEEFSVELNAARRLAEMLENSVKTERQHAQDLEREVDRVNDNASEEIGRITAECDTEHHDREEAERKIAELEVQLERLEADVAMLQDRASARSASPQGINGSTTPRQAMSRGYSPSPVKLRGGISVTQLYSENNSLKGELEAERRRNEKLGNTIDEMMNDLESNRPEVEELRTEHIRLQSEVTEMSALVDTLGKERDQAVKDARKKEGQAEAKLKESDMLRQQLRDLSSQIKVLLMEIHLRQQGLEDISAERHLQLERLAQGQVSEDGLDDSTDTDRFISQNLVTFTNIVQLQEQNGKLLKVTRELGARMEREEAERKQSSERVKSFEELQQNHNRLKDEIKALVTQSQSYIRERDTFKKMLFNRSRDANTELASSVDGDAPVTPGRSVMNSIEGSPNVKDMADYAKLLKDMQAHFDAYRQEAATDRSTLKQQVDSLSRSNSELRGEAARSSSQVTLAHERYAMLQENYGMLKTENAELQKRYQFFSDNAAKQEMRTQQVAEDLVEAQGLADSMRNETAHLKAEKEFWKGVEKRLTEDNRNLLQEQSRLNSLNANLQNLLNEREHSDNEARRRLQVHIDSLERELQTTKHKLAEEVEESKRTSSLREYETQQNQKRIDDLVSSLSSTREELVAAKTTRDHLQTRTDELTIQLRSAEERVSVLQSATPPHPAASNGGKPSQESTVDDAGSSLSKEQELAMQISELKRDLDLARGELDNAKTQVEQYKAISQSSEEELASMNETQDLYRQEMDRLVEEKDAKIQELEARIADTTAELASTNAELSKLRTAQAENSRRMDEQKVSFEAKIAQLKDQVDRHASAAHFYQEDLKAQAEIAQQAQQNYENELVKHADAAKTLQKVRSEHNQLKVEVVEVKTEADSARTSLAQGEESWAESKERYEREISDLKAGRESLNAQNNRLYKQLDDVSSQIANLKQRPSTENDDEHGSATPAAGMENLQEVLKYLRREKEIVDVQLELSSQEAKRLKQQLDYTHAQLDETRLRLNQQRRLEEDSERTSLNHNKLMETINELSTFRESNVTLRNETRQAQAALALKSQQVEELRAQVEPLQAQVRELKNEIETQAAETALLREDRERWQQRTQDILQKYDRIDPAEMEALKSKLHELETERNAVGAAKDALQEQYDGLSEQVTQAQEHGNQRVEDLRQKLTEQFKTRSKQQSGKINEKEQALQIAVKEKEGLEQRLATAQEELKAANIEKENAEQRASSAQAKPGNSRAQSEGEEGQVDETASAKSRDANMDTWREQLTTAETRASEEASRSAALQEEIASSKSRIVELESQINDMQQKLDSSNEELGKLQLLQQRQSTSSPEIAHNEQAEKLQQALAQAQQEVESLRASAASGTSLGKPATETSDKPREEQVAERVEEIRAELESRHKERVAELEKNYTTRTDSMKAQLQKKLNEGKEKYQQAVAAEHEHAIEKIRSDHQEELESLRVRHREEVEELKRHEEARFSQLKNAQASEQLQSHDGPSDAKAETQSTKPITELSEADAKALIQSNNYVRGVLRTNVSKQVEAAKETIKEEHEKELAEKLSEAQAKANTAKEQAVSMETKKNALKVNMAENKMKNVQAKIDVVQTAAEQTPSKPVSEVWEMAKDVKAATANRQPQPTQDGPPSKQSSASNVFARPTGFGQPSAISQGSRPQGQTQATTSGFGKPSAIPQGSQTQGQSQATTSGFGKSSGLFGTSSSAGQPGSFGLPSVPLQTSHGQGQQVAPTSPFGQPSLAQNDQAGVAKPPFNAPQGPAQQPSGRQSSPFEQSRDPRHRHDSPVSNQHGPQHNQSVVGAPQRPSQGGNNPFSQGTGPAALRSLQQSGLPIARGGSRGGNNSRGRGQGRGGPQSIDTSRGQGSQRGRNSPQGRNSPTSASLNANNKQFAPGNKRPREDGQEYDEGDSGQGKRLRG